MDIVLKDMHARFHMSISYLFANIYCSMCCSFTISYILPKPQRLWIYICETIQKLQNHHVRHFNYCNLKVNNPLILFFLLVVFLTADQKKHHLSTQGKWVGIGPVVAASMTDSCLVRSSLSPLIMLGLFSPSHRWQWDFDRGDDMQGAPNTSDIYCLPVQDAHLVPNFFIIHWCSHHHVAWIHLVMGPRYQQCCRQPPKYSHVSSSKNAPVERNGGGIVHVVLNSDKVISLEKSRKL